ncbi:MAG TPA: HD domain-containing protein [Vitreimonas sp.]|nr:HD domain-containing protein [Vitreimonas sp.]
MSGAPRIPQPVLGLLDELWAAGHAGYVVGGSLRDAFLGRTAADWDLATDAPPDRLVALLPGAAYENRFGTVAVRREGEVYEITTFRSDHDYADFRRPHRVEWTDRLDLDLARRDFTVNAMAWGAGRPGAAGEPSRDAPGLVDPFGGRADVDARLLRAVGSPTDRFAEDALRMVRAVRFAAQLGFQVEPGTLAAIAQRADLVVHLSGERIAAELDLLLAAERPSGGLRLLEVTGLLRGISPELAAQRGVAQNKIPGDDLWAHTMRTVDAAPAGNPAVRLAALLHDIGKPATAADGHFYGHDRVGADLARTLLERLHYPREPTDRIVILVRHHMPTYESTWSDAAIRRFIRKVGPRFLDDLWAVQEADNIGSGVPADAGGLAELRRRVELQLAARVALEVRDLAIGGTDLMEELHLSPGPMIGGILERLLDRVMDDPSLNHRPALLQLARAMLEDGS